MKGSGENLDCVYCSWGEFTPTGLFAECRQLPPGFFTNASLRAWCFRGAQKGIQYIENALNVGQTRCGLARWVEASSGKVRSGTVW
jgi:hypothetical protein